MDGCRRAHREELDCRDQRSEWGPPGETDPALGAGPAGPINPGRSPEVAIAHKLLDVRNKLSESVEQIDLLLATRESEQMK